MSIEKDQKNQMNEASALNGEERQLQKPSARYANFLKKNRLIIAFLLIFLASSSALIVKTK